MPLKHDTGTQIQARAWALASPSVVEYISLLSSMSDYRQCYFELHLRDRLSVADCIVLHQRLGVSKFANFVEVVDPWCYPDGNKPAVINVRSYMQSVVNKAASTKISDKTEESITEFLLSPLLVNKGKRPLLVLKPKEQRCTPSQRAAVTAAATVARKPCSPSVELPIIEGRTSQRISPHLFLLPPISIRLTILIVYQHTCISIAVVINFNICLSVSVPPLTRCESRGSCTGRCGGVAGC
jgi:hypothetical protein